MAAGGGLAGCGGYGLRGGRGRARAGCSMVGGMAMMRLRCIRSVPRPVQGRFEDGWVRECTLRVGRTGPEGPVRVGGDRGSAPNGSQVTFQACAGREKMLDIKLFFRSSASPTPISFRHSERRQLAAARAGA